MGKRFFTVRDHSLGPRRAYAILHGALECIREFRGDPANLLEHRFPDERFQVDAEQLLGHRVRVQETSVTVYGEAAAANVEEDVGRLKTDVGEFSLGTGANFLQLARSRSALPRATKAKTPSWSQTAALKAGVDREEGVG